MALQEREGEKRAKIERDRERERAGEGMNSLLFSAVHKKMSF